MQPAPREDRAGLGILLMLGGVTLFTAIDTSAKWLILSGMAPLQVVFARYAGHLVAALAIFVPREGMDAFRSRSPRLQTLRALFLLGSTVLNFFALEALPISLTTTIAFAMPIVVTLLSIPVLGERVGPRRFAAVVAGFGGVLIVVQPWGTAFHPAMGLSLASLTCASCYFILTRMLAGIESNATSQVWAAGIATACIAPVVLPSLSAPASPAAWAVTGGIGLFGAGGHILVTAAHRYALASILSPVLYTQLLLATLAGLFVFDQPPTLRTLAGGAVIIASGLYIWNRERGRAPIPPR